VESEARVFAGTHQADKVVVPITAVAGVARRPVSITIAG
jgi:hypothetical protein